MPLSSPSPLLARKDLQDRLAMQLGCRLVVIQATF
jgi:hypothetical protein